MRTQALLVALALGILATCCVAQPGQDLPPPGQAEGFVPGKVDDVRAIGRLISEAARSKFQQPSDTDAVVDGEYVVTFNLETSPAKINEVARQIKEASGDIEFKALGNLKHGWKGVAFKVPSTQTPEQTAALLDSLLAQNPEVESVQPSLFVRAVRPRILTAADPAVAATVGASGKASGSGRGSTKPKPSPSPAPVNPSPTLCPSFTPGLVTEVSASSWGLDRIDSQARVLSSTYQYSTTAATGVNVFVVDTGIQASHPEFGGRVTLAYDAFGGSAEDGHGHGTHCAGTIGGASVGIARAVKLHAVRVLDASGSGTSATVVNGINFVANLKDVPNRIISMSLGGGYDSAINSAVQGATNAGVLSVVAAGNENADACGVSPASAPSAITVGAVDINDVTASFSNWGSCVDIFAPGVNIYSSTIPSTYASWSGTSMATPHVAGVAARLWSAGVCSSASQCADTLKCMGTANLIGGLTGSKAASPNLMLYCPPGV